jgi:hypothetical protein
MWIKLDIIIKQNKITRNEIKTISTKKRIRKNQNQKNLDQI